MAQPKTAAKPVDEALCTRCGKCCYKKIIVGRTVFITPFPCEFLDTETNLCTIYDRRHELNPLCMSVDAGIKVSAFPADCPYVPEHAPPNYKPASEAFSWTGQWRDFDDLADDLDVSAETRAWVRARGPKAPPKYVETNLRLEREAEEARQAAGGVIWGENAAQTIDCSKPERPAQTPTLADLLNPAPSTPTPGDATRNRGPQGPRKDRPSA